MPHTSRASSGPLPSAPLPPQRSLPAQGRRGGVLAVVAIVVVVLAAVALLWIRSQREAPAVAPDSAQAAADQVARVQIAGWYSLHVVQDRPGSLEEAEKLLAPLLARKEPATEDLLAAAMIARARDRGGDRDEEVRRTLARVLERDQGEPHAHYMLARMELLEGDARAAEAHLRKVIARVPDDLPALLALGQAIEEEAPAEAEKHYRAILARGVDHAGSWYMSALYRLQGLLRERGRDDESERFLEEFDALMDRGLEAPRDAELERGNLGSLAAPPPRFADIGVAVRPLAVAGQETILPELAGFQRLHPCDLDGDGMLDLVAWGARGIAVALRGADGAWRASVLETAAVDWLAAADLTPLTGDKDTAPSALDLVAAVGRSLQWWRVALDAQGVPAWTRAAEPIAELPSPPRDGLFVDYDHEGDLDLALVGGFGLRILRNDGARAAAPGGKFTDATAESRAPMGRPFAWIATEDFDTDQDVDLLCGEPRDVALLSNRRGGTFEAVGDERLNKFAVTPIRPVCADLDLDGRPDLWGAGPFSLVYFNQPSATFRPDPSRGLARGEGSRLGPDAPGQPWAGKTPRALLSTDFDLDGRPDAAWLDADAQEEDVLQVQLAIGRIGQAGFDVALARPRTGNEPALADLDGDLVPEALISTPAGLAVTRFAPPANRGARLVLRGVKDNRRGVGAIVEASAGTRYQRKYWRGEPTDLGLGQAQALDWIRVTWPNGVVQYDLDPGTGARTLVQAEGLIGSCPFLYTWNGERFEFVSDVLGITPLGLPMAPGQLVPPDHDEYVLVRGEDLRPDAEGRFVLQLTEELREVTYLDRLRLDVVDHPEGTEVFPNELFCFPPFPLPHVHTVRDALAPTRATTSDGRDVTAALAAIDAEHAGPREHAPAQLLGLCPPHWIELEFDPARVRDAALLRLFLTGWLYWTDASVNLASARDPDFEFVPPLLQVPDGNGGWRDTGPPVGFPAGKTKTMVVDVSALLLRDDPRLRIVSTLRLHWDAIRLAVDADDAPLVVTPLEAVGARLWRRGFSAAVRDPRPDQPERFSWDELEPRARWNPHPGIYTKYGEVNELIGAIDERFVVMGSGDALEVRFDASAAPALPAGWRRDFLLFLDGWAKDRDHNTVEALHVEPLPFHGMSGYPYGDDESFPRTSETRAWLREWQTRPAEPWIPRRAR